MFGSIIFPKTRYGFFRFDNVIAAGKSRQDQTRHDFYPPGIAIHGRKKLVLSSWLPSIASMYNSSATRVFDINE